MKKGDEKIVEAILPENFPEKELVNKKAKFNCKVTAVKNPEEVKINDDFAKNLGAKDLNDLKNLGTSISMILGDKDRLVDLKAVENFTNMVPSKTYTMNEVGHFSFFEDPAELSKLISQIV